MRKSRLFALLVGVLFVGLAASQLRDVADGTRTGVLFSGAGLEAALPEGKETDPFAILRAEGYTVIPNHDMVESLRGTLEAKPFSFEGLAPKRGIEGVFKVAPEEPFWPPDAGCTGPYFLVREEGRYHVLTERNFARVFAPVESSEEALAYARAYADLFLTAAFGILVTREDEVSRRNNRRYPAEPPEVTTVQDQSGKYRVRLVYYTEYGRQCFFALDLEVRRNGRVEQRAHEILQEFGPGFMF